MSASTARLSGLFSCLLLLVLLTAASADEEAPTVMSLRLDPTVATAGGRVTGDITLTGPAPAGGATVILASSNPVATVMPRVTIPAGSWAATFPIRAAVPGSAVITATFEGSSRTFTLMVNAPSAPFRVSILPHLADLSDVPAAISAGGGATGTVRLSAPAPAGGARVALHSSDRAVSVPAVVLVPAGAVSKTFGVAASPVTAVTSVTLAGTYGGWTQGAELRVMPSGLSYGIPRINVDPGNGCAIVMWERLPGEALRGYNVYRTGGGTTTLLTPKPYWRNYYLDAGLTNDADTYSYQVAAVDALGQEHARSSPVSVTPSSAIATWNWVKTAATATGDVTLSLQLSNGGYAFAESMLIDGEDVGTGCASRGVAPGGVPTNITDSTLDSSRLSNGPHTVQFRGFLDEDRTIACASPPITVQFSNVLSDLSWGGYFSPKQGDLSFISATASVGSTWSVQVTREDDGSLIRSWRGATPTIRLAWDGTDAAGKLCPYGGYTLQITVQPAGPAAQPAPGAAPLDGGAITKSRGIDLSWPTAAPTAIIP